jgi:hypothetical protein
MPRLSRQTSEASLDQAFRAMIRREVEAQLLPLQTRLSQIQSGNSELAALRATLTQLTPLASLLGGRGAFTGARGGRRGRKGGLARERGCAIIGCRRPSRTKGYCAAHYQKLRMLTRTNRRPVGWVDFAPPSSVQDVVLPRGRAAHKARRQQA